MSNYFVMDSRKIAVQKVKRDRAAKKFPYRKIASRA